MKVISSLPEWTLEAIQEILNFGIKENQHFDFKLQLPLARPVRKFAVTGQKNDVKVTQVMCSARAC